MKKLSIVMPVYNEVRTIKEVLQKLLDLELGVETELIIVDDSSTDGTIEVLKSLTSLPKLKIIFSFPNRGKSFAVRKGLEYVSGDVVVIQDADLEYFPEDFQKFIDLYKTDDSLEVVYGSRFLGVCENMWWGNLIANKILTFITNLFYRVKITDSCTCYKSFRSRLINELSLEANGFAICHELNSKLLPNYKFAEVPIKYYARSRAEGKKASWVELLRAFREMVRFKYKSYGFKKKIYKLCQDNKQKIHINC